MASLSRVFADERYALWAIGAVVVGVAVAALFGPRSLGSAIVILTVGWIITLPALFAPRHTFMLLPTGRAVDDIRTLIGEGLAKASAATPPIETHARYMVLVWTAFLFLGFLGAAWVVVRRPIGAVVAALGIVVFAGGLGDGPGRNAFAFAGVAAAGAVFLSEGRQRIERWGRSPVPVWFGVPTLAAASLLALGAPAVLGESALINLNGALRPRLVIVKPLSDVKRQLDVEPPIEVMRVDAQRSAYWRLTGLDSYDGREWVLNARPRSALEGAVPPPEPAPAGETNVQTFTLTSLLSPWMPAAYAAVRIETEREVDVDARSQTLLLRGETSPGVRYTVHSRAPRVTENLPVPPRDVSDDRADIFGALARPIIGNARTPLDMARTLEAHFREFRYDENVERGHTVERLQRFLRDRRGYCEQFAATMTLMLRGLGVPARVGVGFLPGAKIRGEYVVSTRDAHAWVEADIPGAGWIAFDPTPARGEPSAVPPDVAEDPVPLPTVVPVEEPEPQFEDVPADELAGGSGGFPIGRVLPYALAAMAIASIPVAKRVRRARRRSAPPREAVVGAFAELGDRAAELGWRARPAETHREFGRRLFDEPGDGADAAAQLVDITSKTLFGPAETEGADAAAAWEAASVTIGALRRRARWWRRALAVVDPRPLVPPSAIDRVRPVLIRMRVRPAPG